MHLLCIYVYQLLESRQVRNMLKQPGHLGDSCTHISYSTICPNWWLVHVRNYLTFFPKTDFPPKTLNPGHKPHTCWLIALAIQVPCAFQTGEFPSAWAGTVLHPLTQTTELSWVSRRRRWTRSPTAICEGKPLEIYWTLVKQSYMPILCKIN